MITVVVFINERVIYARSARNIGQEGKYPYPHKYKVDDGRILIHSRDDGALPLAKQMLEGVIEP